MDASWIDSEVSVTGIPVETFATFAADWTPGCVFSPFLDCDVVPLIVTFSKPSWAVSVFGSNVNVPVPLVALAAIVTVKSDTAL